VTLRTPFGLNDADSKAPQASDTIQAIALAYPAADFVTVPINNIMTGVLDAPVATVGVKHALMIGIFNKLESCFSNADKSKIVHCVSALAVFLHIEASINRNR
jgi:hypothetical protein